MASVAQTITETSNAARVLSEAIARIADLWGMSNARLGAIIGLSGPTVSRLRSGAYSLEPGSKSFELSQHLLRLFRSLDSWLGQDDDAARSWLQTHNLDLQAAPIELIGSIRGLLNTGDYVDALRARV